jgi:amino acid transporter
VVVPPDPDPDPEPEVVPIVTPPPRQQEITVQEPKEPEAKGIPTVTLFGNEIPLYASEGEAAWALLNLILTILSFLLAIIAIVSYYYRKYKDEENDRGEITRRYKLLKRRLVLLVLAVVALIVFIFTEDMRLPIVMLDWWTIFHVVIVGAIIIIFALAHKKEDDVDYDEMQNLDKE